MDEEYAQEWSVLLGEYLPFWLYSILKMEISSIGTYSVFKMYYNIM